MSREAGNLLADEGSKQALTKGPAVTLGFWVIKILATTLGETGGDTVTMTLNWGYVAGVALFGIALVALVAGQILAKRFHATLYWATIVASTTFGTTLADFADRSLGIGYTGGSLLLLGCLLATLGLWRWSEGTVAVSTVSTPKVEAFYWATITFSQTLGTALGDWLADTRGFGYERGALVFAAALAIVVALYYWTRTSRVTLFWVAFILTRPLGATVGDFVDKPVADGVVVGSVGNGVDGLYEAIENSFDVVVLDIMLPGHSGYEVLRRMRAQDVWTPVLMLTAKDGEYDETDAFDLGADDYLTKPFSFRVLVARIHALVRRGAPERPVVLTAGSLSLDPARHKVERGSIPITLTPREFGLLEFLIRNKDMVVTKAEILQNVWDAHYQGPDNVVEVYVGYLRRKIDVPFGTNTIETIRGVGYRLLC